MKRRALLVIVAAFAFAYLRGSALAEENRWEGAIQAFEKQDAERPVKAGGILFLGSSSIRLWDTDRCFPKHDVLNRGFGGSEVSDAMYFFDRIVMPYRPRLIALYAGDNDIAAGETAGQVLADFQAFVARMKAQLPGARLIYIGIKPSLARWHLVEEMRAANTKIKAACDEDPTLRFLDVDTPIIGEDGKPRKDLFKPDGLHLNEKGYALWTELTLPLLDSDSE